LVYPELELVEISKSRGAVSIIEFVNSAPETIKLWGTEGVLKFAEKSDKGLVLVDTDIVGIGG